MLLEVVLALSIFIVAVVGLLRCLHAGLDADYEQQRLTNMRLNLQSLLDESLASPPREEKIEIPEDVFHVRYRRVTAPTRVKAAGKDLADIYKISVVAMDGKRDGKVIGELWTYASR
jgi:hypothetical protein